MTAGGRTSTYNPGSLTRAELIATFAARGPVLAKLLDDVRRGGQQHHLIIGQRGAGKTTLLLRLAYAIDEDAELKARALPLRFPEEQYNVARPADFWLNCVDALIDALEERGDVAAARKLDAEVDRLEELDEDDRAREGLALLTGWAKQSKRLLVLLVDNLDLILERLSGHHWTLREVLSADNRLMLIGASSTFIQESFNYGEAFYDFFHVHELAPLTEDEARAMLEHLADATDTPHVRDVLKEPGRFAALHLLSGGMPRTLVMLHRILAAGTSSRAEEDLEALLDQVTPYYKARFDELPAQSQQIVHALAMHWHPMTAIECSTAAHLDINTASSQLNRLVRQGLLSKLASADSAKLSFLITERFFAIWYSMRASRRLRRKLLWLVEVIHTLYGQQEVERRAQELLAAGDGLDVVADPARLLAYATKVADGAVRRQLELRAVEAIVTTGMSRGPLDDLLDVTGDDRHLMPLIDRVQALQEIRQRIEGGEGREADKASMADWVVSQPHWSLRQKARIAARSVDELVSLAVSQPLIVGVFGHLHRAVARGEVPSLPDAVEEGDLAQIVAIILRDASVTYERDPITARALMVVLLSVTIATLRDHSRTRDESISDRSARRLLELALEAQTDESVSLLLSSQVWGPVVALGMAGDAATLLARRGWAERLMPTYEALRAAAEGRRGPLVHLAPELRRPAEEMLAEMLAASAKVDVQARPYRVQAGGASRAADSRPVRPTNRGARVSGGKGKAGAAAEKRGKGPAKATRRGRAKA